MLTPISRRAIFQASAFADQFIAEMQQSYAGDLDPNDDRDAAMLSKLYDHRQSIQAGIPLIDGHCVIAYDTALLADYQQSFPLVLHSFLQELSISQLYLMDFVKTNLLDYPFENFKKRNRFKRLGAVNNNRIGYLVQVEHLPEVLPLFYFSRKWDVPLIFFITAQGKVPLSMRLCDDGNFHLNYPKSYHPKIAEAATGAGLVMGDLEICGKHSVYYLVRN
jgi:hypothetical protein